MCNLRKRKTFYLCSERNPLPIISVELKHGQIHGITNGDMDDIWSKTALGKNSFPSSMSSWVDWSRLKYLPEWVGSFETQSSLCLYNKLPLQQVFNLCGALLLQRARDWRKYQSNPSDGVLVSNRLCNWFWRKWPNWASHEGRVNYFQTSNPEWSSHYALT